MPDPGSCPGQAVIRHPEGGGAGRQIRRQWKCRITLGSSALRDFLIASLRSRGMQSTPVGLRHQAESWIPLRFISARLPSLKIQH